jgi:hypothetical protein
MFQTYFLPDLIYWKIQYHMIVITQPSEIEHDRLQEIVELLLRGGQVHQVGLQERILRSDFVAYKIINNKVICTATLKNPHSSYRIKVFNSAKFPVTVNYKKELGYIVTHPDFENIGHCQDLLLRFFNKISTYSMYATTRKPSMVHILSKMGFKVTGKTYNQDLKLLIYNSVE